MKAVTRHEPITSGKERACNQELVTPRLTHGGDCALMQQLVSMKISARIWRGGSLNRRRGCWA
ncbi:MAG TPA: hypothetical protein P5182_12115, partial [Myxococcota bacterium]|nr:hypothetical protein [Myxococcota bacterium]